MGRCAMRGAVASLVVGIGACGPGEVTSERADASGVDATARADGGTDAARDAPPRDSSASDRVDVPTPRDAPLPDVFAVDARASDVVDLGNDDAEIVEVIFPSTLSCAARTQGTVRVRNRGTTTWTLPGRYALGAVDDGDPFFTRDTRVRFGEGVTVAPGETWSFAIPLASPGAAGEHTSDWRMVRDGVRWFGDTASPRVRVTCAPPPTTPFRLSDVQIIASPDVRGFAVTSRLTALGFRPGTFRIDHTRRGMWPPVTIADDGTTQEATVWVFFHIDGTWYGTGGERLRPNQTEKSLENPSLLATDWFYDRNRWGVLTGYVPSPGELVGFMVVAGSTRADDRTPVRERTNVALVPFPSDGADTSFPPFAWEE
ncbi:MAG: NBR1-Ig-like domain-containing protein [Polyangiales bacterium]